MGEKFIVQTSTPERKFIKVYLDFLNTGLLSGKEQIIFIHLKQYINFANDTGTVREEVYPTLATLAKNVKMSEKTVRTVLQSLQRKGILEIKQQGINKPKSQAERYTIQDIRMLYEYDSLIIQYPKKKTDIDVVFDILYDTLNSTKQYTGRW